MTPAQHMPPTTQNSSTTNSQGGKSPANAAVMSPLIPEAVVNGDEAQTMGRLEKQLAIAEEQDLLRRIGSDICKAEAFQKFKRKVNLGDHVQGLQGPQQSNRPETKEFAAQPTRKRPRPTKPRDASENRVESLTTIEAACKATKILPKLHEGTVLFTRGEFFLGVVDFVEQQYKTINPWLQCQLELEELPEVYRLHYRGPKALLETVLARTQDWIQCRVTQLNLQRLLDDPESLVLHVELNSKLHIGGQVGTPFVNHIDSPRKEAQKNRGVWFTGTNHKKGLPRLLGQSALDPGCAILAINANYVRSKEILYNSLILAKQHPTPKMLVTLVLSKYADLTKVNTKQLTRRDEHPLDLNYYKRLREEWVDRMKDRDQNFSLTRRNAKQSWIEHPAKTFTVPPSFPKEGPTGQDSCLRLAHSMLLSQTSVEIDVVVASDVPLGCSATWHRQHFLDGIFCTMVKESSQLCKIFGPKAVRVGMILTKINGVVIRSKDQLVEEKSKVDLFDGTFRGSFLFLEGTDFSQIDRTKLVQGRINPRYRNGKSYPLHLTSKPRTTSAAPVSKKANDRVQPSAKGKNGNDALVDPKASKKRPHSTSTNGEISKKARTASSQDRAKKAVGAHNTTPATKATDSLSPSELSTSYTNFQKKYLPAARIDYGNTMINMKYVISSMWKQHKEIMGRDAFCDENCKCLSRLPGLRKYVVEDYINDQQKKGKTIDEKDIKEVGFIKYFGKKFLPRLRKEYPNDNMQQLLDRLVNMWPLHAKQRLYGITCRKDCECEDAWELIFGKGDPSKAEYQNRASKQSAKAHSATQGNLAGSAAVTAVDGDRVPRKRSSFTLEENKAASEEGTESKGHPHKKSKQDMQKLSIGRMLSNMEKAKERKSESGRRRKASQLDDYEISLDASAPLGIFFVNDFSSVKVHSVDPIGQARTRDPSHQVHKGTIVRSIKFQSRVTQINDWEELRKQYEELHSQKATFSLILNNLHATMTAAKDEWSKQGMWQGEQIDGWDGGATLLAELKFGRGSKPVPTRAAEESKETMASENLLVGSNEAPARWSVQDTVYRSVHRSKPAPKSILHSKEKRKASNRVVSFAKALVEHREYDPSKKASEQLVRVSEADDHASGVPTEEQSPDDKLRQIVEKGTCREVISLLQGGNRCEPSVKEATLKELVMTCGGLIESTNLQLSDNPSDKNRKRLEDKLSDLEAKSFVLKLYVSSSFWIGMTMSLNSWTWLEIKVLKVEIRKRDNKYVQGRSDVLAGRALCLINSQKQENLGLLPPQRLHENIEYDDGDATVPFFTTCNNLHFEGEERHFALELMEGSPEDSAPPLVLGRCTFALSKYDQLCPKGEAIEFSVPIRPNENLKSADVTFEMRKHDVTKDWILKRKREAQIGIIEKVESIFNFNKKYNDASYVLSGHIQDSGRVSLLHAAINLQAEDLVKRLSELGVKPRETSHRGTSLGLAMKIKETISEKMRKENNEETLKLLHMYERIVALLRTHTESETKAMAEAKTNHTATAGTNEGGLSESSKGDGSSLPEDPTGLYGDLPLHKEAYSTTNNKSMADADILREIIESSAPIEGYKNGTAARKSFVSLRLKDRYPQYFSTTQETRAFLDRVITTGLVVQHGVAGNVVLQLVESARASESTTSNALKRHQKNQYLDPLPSDQDLLCELLPLCPTPSGYKRGTAVEKCVLGSRVKESKYGRHFPKGTNKLRDFFQRLQDKGLVEQLLETSPVVLKLAAPFSNTAAGGYETQFRKSLSSPTASANQTQTSPGASTAASKPIPADEVLLKELMQSAQPAPGARQGQAVLRSTVGSWLSKKYPEHYSKASMKAFCDRLMAKGLIVQSEGAHGAVFRIFA